MGLRRTVELIVTDPRRSRFWKVFDVTLLSVLWLGAAVLTVLWLRSSDVSGWYVALRLWVTIAVLATFRSWYRFPRPSR